MVLRVLLLLLLCCRVLSADDRLCNDLLIVEYCNQRAYDRFPVMYNHLLQGGYFAMPSARMGEDGEIGVGYSYVSPYRNYNLRMQLFSHFEITGNYRVFHGIKDPVLSPFGFGDLSDKGANFKWAILKPEDSDYTLPGLAIGLEDFIGTRAFHSQYLVLTQVIKDFNFEASLGFGKDRLGGFFGGVQWIPFHGCEYPLLAPFCLVAEYDATRYKSERREPHPKGRKVNSPINVGWKYRLWDRWDLSMSYMRGNSLAFSASTYYNFGNTTGLLPKINNPPPYTSPIHNESLGPCRPEESLAPELAAAFRQQNLDLLEVRIYFNEWGQKGLRLRILNETYWEERALRCRINDILAALMPCDIAEVIAVIDSEGFPIQEYHYNMDFVRKYAVNLIGFHELEIVTPLTDVTFCDPYGSSLLLFRQRNLFNFELSPNTHTFFGSSTGKFKYTLGVHGAFNGFLPGDIYYSILTAYNFATSLGKVNDFDILNPSQLINVRTDIIRYYNNKGFNLDEAYLQKNWNLGNACYGKLAAGYFEIEYGGVSTEFLYYPVNSPWAVGFEAAILKKRDYRGLGFTNKIRKLDGYIPTYRKFLGSQYFANIYYDLECAEVAFKLTGGKFLANDYGVRGEITRYFPSGMTLTLWYTMTNGNDKINGKTYYDKGVWISMPFDIFYTHSERTRWGYGMSAWLRDVGVQALTGLQLYQLINEQRQY